jgi:hypothetical protein
MSPGLRYLSTTVALLAVGLGYALVQGRGERPTPRPEAQSEAVARPVPPPAAPPTAGEILERRASFSLTADQVSRLEALDAEWKREAAEIEPALAAAEQALSRFMKEAQSAGGTSVQEIQRRSAEFRELSAALRERRRLHSEAAAHVLTESQRRQLAAATSTGTPGGGR